MKASFPIHCLPTHAANFIDQLDERQGLVADYMACTFLAIASVCCGKKIVIYNSSTHSEPPVLWQALVGTSSSKKSPSMEAMMRPLKNVDEAFDIQYRTQLSEWKLSQKEGSNATCPICKQCTVDDLTIEALADVLDSNRHGLLMKKDELIAWRKEGGRYSSGSGNGEEERWLSFYNCGTYRINRKSKEGNRLILNPFVSVIGGIQPGTLQSLLSKERISNGFINRILFCQPEFKEQFIPVLDVDPDTIKEYDHLVKILWDKRSLNNPDESHVPLELHLSPQARARYNQWKQEFSLPILNDKDGKELIKGYVSKLEATVLRISGILAYAWEGTCMPREITELNVNRAIAIINYFYGCWIEMTENVPGLDVDKSTIHQQMVLDAVKDTCQDKMKLIVKNLDARGMGNNEIGRLLGLAKSTVNHFRSLS